MERNEYGSTATEVTFFASKIYHNFGFGAETNVPKNFVFYSFVAIFFSLQNE